MNVLLGVCGGIAAYKVCELVRSLTRRKHEVIVIMTKHAKKFISTLTMQQLSGHIVYDKLFANKFSLHPQHIKLAQWADIFVVVPATANTIAKLARGFADDLLSCTALSFNKLKVICPAMNDAMYNNALVQENIDKLKRVGYQVIEPEFGSLLEGEGVGRLSDVNVIVEKIEALKRSNNKLAQKKILITAGATREPIDPVRFISNPSSGRMGYYLAQAAFELGSQVCVVHGVVADSLNLPQDIECIFTQTTKAMYSAVLKKMDWADMLISAAAVCDYHPKNFTEKIQDKEISIKLIRNPDIIKQVKHRYPKKFIVGFCAETSWDILLMRAKEKLQQKKVDVIVANLISCAGQDYIEGYIVTKETTEKFDRTHKRTFARKLLEYICRLNEARLKF